MSMALGPRRVTSPDGVEWRVGRKWFARGLGWSWRRRREAASESLNALGSAGAPGGGDSAEAFLLTVAVVAAALILVPVLFFGAELILLGALLAGGLVSHIVLRRPWMIEARSTDPLTSGRQLEWHVRGWRPSGKLIDQIVAELAAGREPPSQSTLLH